MDRYTALQDGKFTAVSGKVLVKIGDVEYQANQNEYLPQGASITAEDGAQFQIQFKDGQVHSNSNFEENNAHLVELNALTDIQSLQSIIAAGGDPTIELPETAAGPTNANEGGSGFTTLERDGSETTASTKFDSSGFIPPNSDLIQTRVEALLDLAPTILTSPPSESIESGVDANNEFIEGTPSINGQITAVDDIDEAFAWSVVEGNFPYGEFSIDAATGQWVFTLNNNAEIVQALQVGQIVSLTYTIQVEDSNGGIDTEVVTITVTGTNDRPLIENGPQIGAVDEAGIDASNNDIAGISSVSGDLNASDVDNEQIDLSWSLQSNQFADYGEFVLNSETGQWTFNLFNDSPVVQAMQEGDAPIPLIYQVRVSDGLGGFSNTTVTINVTGTNDRPLVENGPQTGAVDEAGIDTSNNDIASISSVSGDLNASDVDNAQSDLSWSLQSNQFADYGEYVLNSETGQWTFNLFNDSPVVQAMQEGDE
ncbi:MAG: retention module-containing protein, partial [Shewanella sp.]|nr:retention module-containing protein [Shewanella sp.]